LHKYPTPATSNKTVFGVNRSRTVPRKLPIIARSEQ
jgi:hypothetical protein